MEPLFVSLECHPPTPISIPPLKVSSTKSNLWGSSKYPREQPVSCSSTNSAYQTNNPQIAADSSETSNPDSIM